MSNNKPYTEDELRKCINAALKNLVDNAGKPDDKFLYRQCDIQTDAIMAAVAHTQPKEQQHVTSVSVDELRKELFYIVWEWFKENRFYTNWRTEDQREEWVASDFSLVTSENSAGSLAMEVGLLVARLLKHCGLAQPPDHSGCLSREQKVYKRGYNTGFQKHKRINKRNAGVIVQLEAIVETLRSDDQLGLSGSQEKEKTNA